jgi:hypothetical protein
MKKKTLLKLGKQRSIMQQLTVQTAVEHQINNVAAQHAIRADKLCEPQLCKEDQFV